VIIVEGQNSLEREDFTNVVQTCEETRQKAEISRRQTETIRQKNNRRKSLESKLYFYYFLEREVGKVIIIKIKN
jgi:hypothetical protein